MSQKWKVVVEGGNDNLYYISESMDTYYIYQTHVHIPFDDNDLVGQTDSLELALVLIRSHSGDDIEKIVEV